MVSQHMRLAVLAPVCAVLFLLGAADARQRPPTGPQLMQLITPAAGAPVSAHPDVNVVVRFPGAPDSLADPDTFHARLGGRDITDRFEAIIEGGTQVGVRAAIPQERLRLGRRRSNRLRLLVRRREVDAKGRSSREIVKVRFRAVEQDNVPPQAIIVPESEVIFPNLALEYDASRSFDQEHDALTYQWDFGDGTTSTDVTPQHTYPTADEERTVTLTVSDGQASASARIVMRSCPQPEGATPGDIALEADAPLEFGAVAPGGSATRSFRVRNGATDVASVLATCIGFDGPGFSVSPTRLDLRAQEAADVTVTFAPGSEGHAAATIALVSAASDRPVISLLAHGYGGNAPGPGPTQAAAPVFYFPPVPEFGRVGGFLPSGAPFTPDTGVYGCEVPSGIGSRDACVTDADCAPNAGTCPQTPTSYAPFDAERMCADGAGGLYLLGTEGTFTDPAPPVNDAELAISLLRVTLDPSGNATSRAILARTTSETAFFACDRFSAENGGRVYLAEYHVVDVSGCFRGDKEVLVALRKSNGNSQTVMPRIDAATGLSDCDDIDNVTHLEVSPDGSEAFASFDSAGLWRLRPTPLQFLDSSFVEELFRVHPDGSIVFATVDRGPTAATVRVFKVSPSQVASNPLPVSGLVPCASFQVPHRPDAPIGIFPNLAVGPAAPGSRDATVLVSVAARSSGSQLSGALTVRATIAFSALADSSVCTPLGIINLERMDGLTF